ncbi:pseudouridine synthase [Roseibium sp. MMSF_3544]|uniref:pseudouridine synthase n=1 Tax=unclassified Roseibium TaxID=2629323 RepID=UPI00273E8957|nr:pseudouridine synthase [Roseibium sp. MMSF_3544]
MPDKKRSGPPAAKKAGPAPANQPRDDAAERGERIAKVMARAGLCSRREAETWIENGRVELNGKVLTTPAITVTGNDKVLVDGEPLPTRERTRLWLYHKPRGLVTTNKDPEGRPTVFQKLPDELPRVLTVGRLDINTEGLLLLTNDGGLARVLELPSTGWLRRYRVRAFGKIAQADLDGLADGIAIDGVLYGAIEATLDKEQGGNVWITVGLREGKNREVKRVLEHLGLTVNRLIRISYGPFQLMDLPEGDVREIRGRILRDQLGETLAREAGADFDAPIFHQPQQDKPKKAREGRQGSGKGPARKSAGREAAQGKWLTAREGKSETDRRKAAKATRSDEKQAKRKNAGPRQEKVSPRSRFRMTSNPKPRKDFAEERQAPQRRIWSEDGLVEDKQQESRTGRGSQDRSERPDRGGRPRGGNRS